MRGVAGGVDSVGTDTIGHDLAWGGVGRNEARRYVTVGSGATARHGVGRDGVGMEGVRRENASDGAGRDATRNDAVGSGLVWGDGIWGDTIDGTIRGTIDGTIDGTVHAGIVWSLPSVHFENAPNNLHTC